MIHNLIYLIFYLEVIYGISQNKIVKAALLGAGTVGSGVYELVKERQEDFPHICGTQIEIARFLSVMLQKKEKEFLLNFSLTTGKKSLLMTVSLLLQK